MWKLFVSLKKLFLWTVDSKAADWSFKGRLKKAHFRWAETKTERHPGGDSREEGGPLARVRDLSEKGGQLSSTQPESEVTCSG